MALDVAPGEWVQFVLTGIEPKKPILDGADGQAGHSIAPEAALAPQVAMIECTTDEVRYRAFLPATARLN